VIAGISFAGFSWYREVEVGGGYRVLVISCKHGGGLMVFGPSLRLTSSMKTDDIKSVTLLDLDEDGISEVLTDEVEGEGTGILLGQFVVYRVSPGPIRRLWDGVSLYQASSWDPKAGFTGGIRREGFVRFDPSGGGVPARLLHVTCEGGNSPCKERSFELRGGVIQEISEFTRNHNVK
jgi:hypothetical protein